MTERRQATVYELGTVDALKPGDLVRLVFHPWAPRVCRVVEVQSRFCLPDSVLVELVEGDRPDEHGGPFTALQHEIEHVTCVCCRPGGPT